jgi:hypothetical protein
MADPAPAKPSAAAYESDELELIDRVTKRDRTRLIVANGLKTLPERRVEGAIDDEETRAKNQQHKIVEDEVVAKVDEPQLRWRRNLASVDRRCRVG